MIICSNGRRVAIACAAISGVGALLASQPVRAAGAPATPAATTAPTASAAPANDTTLEEVVVTAEKRQESALTTPVALTAYSSDSLKENQIVTVADLQNVDPSLNISKGGFGQWGDTISIRGVTSVDGTSKGTPGIAFNIDGIPINRGYEQSEAFFDLDRVELLKGPQGTLYGSSSTGGALNIITNKPKDYFEASTDVTVGDYNTRRTTDVINVPVTDAVALRAAVNYNYHDGYEILPDGTPYTNGENDFTTRLSGLVKFNSDMNLLLQETIGNIGGPGPGQVNYDTLLSQPTGSAQRVVYDSPFEQQLNDTFSNLTGQFNWDLGRVHLTYVGGYMNYSANDFSGSTNNPLANDSPATGLEAPPFYTVPIYGWREYRGHFLTNSQELRFSNQEPGPFEWVVGANWFRENIHESDHNWDAVAPSADSYPTVADSVNAIDPLDQTIHTAKGIFGQSTWHTTDKLDLTLGLRETQDDLARYGTFAAGPVAGCVAPADCVGPLDDGSESDSKLTYRANAAYHFTPVQMVYATIASGFKPGGFNDFCVGTSSSGPCIYKPEELVSYELGYKGRPLENFEIDSDVFYYNYSSRQVSQLDNINGALVIFTSTAPAVIEGWENDFIYRVTHVDEVHLDVTNLRSYYRSLDTYLPSDTGPIGAPINLAGYTMNATPTTAATLSYFHDIDLANGASVRLHAEIKYSSSYYENQIGPYYPFTQPKFTRSDADIRYTSPDGKFYIGAFILNIENKLQIAAAPNDGGTLYPVAGAQAVGVTDPRTWGFNAGLRM